jgi:hypothetical protein
MRRYSVLFLTLAALIGISLASPALAQSKTRLGVGYAVTHYDPFGAITLHMPKFVIQTPDLSGGAGFSLHSGENNTMFNLEFDFSYRAIKQRSATIGFGGQIDVGIDYVIGNAEDTLFGFGGFVEGLVDVAPNLSVGARLYPLMIVTWGDANRVEFLSAGATINFLF